MQKHTVLKYKYIKSIVAKKKKKKKIRGTIQQLITKTKKVSLRMEKKNLFVHCVCNFSLLFHETALWDVMFDIILCSFHTLLNSSVRLKD